jgi:hypothetical protein
MKTVNLSEEQIYLLIDGIDAYKSDRCLGEAEAKMCEDLVWLLLK